MIYDLFNNAIEHWKSKRCIGTAFIPEQLDDKSFLLLVLNRIYSIPKIKFQSSCNYKYISRTYGYCRIYNSSRK